VNAIASRVNQGISLEPQLHLRGRKQKITGETAAAVLQYYAEHPHATLEEVISALHLDASVPTLSRYLHRHKRSYKKKGCVAKSGRRSTGGLGNRQQHPKASKQRRRDRVEASAEEAKRQEQQERKERRERRERGSAGSEALGVMTPLDVARERRRQELRSCP